MKNRNPGAARLAANAMLAAMCTVLGGAALRLGGNLEFTFESVPVHLAALLFGPIDGAIVGFIGTFIYQVLLSGYGITVTTPLWILPYVVCGLVVGFCTNRINPLERRTRTIGAIVMGELLITLLNTLALYVDSVVFSYYSAAFVFGTLAIRLAVCVAKAVVYGALFPSLLKPLLKTIRRI